MPDASADAGDGGFFDDFARAEGDDIGSGWTEKSPDSFVLTAGTARKSVSAVKDYRDNLVYRPATEDRRDVEVAIEFTSGGAGSPQLFVRADRTTITTTDAYLGYVVYVATPGLLVLLRQVGSAFGTVMSSASISPPVEPSKRHRLRVSARGSIRVILDTVVERFDGGTWQTASTLHHEDDRPERFADAGALGFAASISTAGPVYDNFSWRPLDPL